jgi:hypothetical protein
MTVIHGVADAAQDWGARLRRVRGAAFGNGLGVVVVAVGLLLIGIGWNGMAGGGGEINGVPNLNAQLPWLISGGVLGLALVVFGSAIVVVHNARVDRARLEAKLDELTATLGRPAGATTVAATARFVAGASSYHRADCRLVKGRTGLESISAEEARDRGLKACRICKPA